MSSDDLDREADPGFFDPDDLSWDFDDENEPGDQEAFIQSSEGASLPDPAELFRQMAEETKPQELPDAKELYEQISEPEPDPEPSIADASPSEATTGVSRAEAVERLKRLMAERDGVDYEPVEAQTEEEDLPDPQELFHALTGGAVPQEEPENEELPDPTELFNQMVEREGTATPSSENDEEELPDPEELYRKLVGEAKASVEEELPDSDALFQQLTQAQIVSPIEASPSQEPIPPGEDDLPDPEQLFREMSQQEVKDDLHLPLPSAPEESAPEETPGLWSRFKSKFSTNKEVDDAIDLDPVEGALPEAALPSIPLPEEPQEDSLELNIPLPTSEPTQARVESPSPAPTGFWGRIKSKFGAEKSEEIDQPALFEQESEPELPSALPSLPDARAMFEQMEAEEEDEDDDSPAFPSPEELFRQLEREEREEMEASTAGAALPDLPDLDSFRAELEQEERERLDPDLLGDLSGPEMFADTVSDLAFTPKEEFEKPLPPVKEPPTEKPLPAMLSAPEPVKKGPTGTVRVDAGSKAPKPASRPKPAYRPSASSGAAPVVKSSKKKVEVDGKSFRETWAGRSKSSSFSRYTLTIFTRQLAAMLKAGVQLHMALSFCADSSPQMAKVLDDVGEKIQRGFTMSAAFGEHPKSFDPIYVGLLRSGELSGRLPEVIDRLANVLEREMELKKRVTSALTYPAVLLLVSLLGTLGFLYFVLPMITPLFEDLGVPLPLPTRILMGIRTVMVPTVVLVSVGGFVTWLMKDRISAFLNARPRLERRIAGFLYKIPVFGDVYQKLVASRVLYSLATMLDVGVTMNQALARAESASGNALMSYRLAKAREDLADGNPVTDCFSANKVFTGTALHLIGAGEESAQLTEMFTYVAGYYDEEVEYSMDSAASLLEPIIMVVMGLVVGFITIGAALPTITLLQNFT